MLQTLKQRYRNEEFAPGLLAALLLPSFFARRALHRAISAHAHHLHGRLLDFGCGRKPYRSLFEVDAYVGLDTENSGHKHADESIDVLYDGNRIPFDDEHFDAVFSAQVFEHVQALDASLEEIKRVMKPGATIVVTVPFIWGEHEQPYDFRRFTTFGAEALFASHGFVDIEVKRSSNAVETIFQMWNSYIERRLLPRARVPRYILQLLLIAPVTIVGILLSAILPAHDELYLDNIVVARKP